MKFQAGTVVAPIEHCSLSFRFELRGVSDMDELNKGVLGVRVDPHRDCGRDGGTWSVVDPSSSSSKRDAASSEIADQRVARSLKGLYSSRLLRNSSTNSHVSFETA